MHIGIINGFESDTIISKSLVLLAIILFQCANAINVVWIGVTRHDWVSLTLPLLALSIELYYEWRFSMSQI